MNAQEFPHDKPNHGYRQNAKAIVQMLPQLRPNVVKLATLNILAPYCAKSSSNI